jgi:hypothetical protein
LVILRLACTNFRRSDARNTPIDPIEGEERNAIEISRRVRSGSLMKSVLGSSEVLMFVHHGLESMTGVRQQRQILKSFIYIVVTV